MKLVLKEADQVKEPRITLYTDPGWRGADIDHSIEEELPTVMIDMKNLVPFEPMEKVEGEHNRKTVTHFIGQIEKGIQVKPILVRKVKKGLLSSQYQVIDGHHRYAAHLIVKAPRIAAKVVPNSEIKIVDKPNQESEV